MAAPAAGTVWHTSPLPDFAPALSHMIVPDHWAEARKQHRSGGRQVTVRRFGWSNESAADAQVMAEQRVDDALQRILSGEALERREPKRAYNGASGVPIREEVLARHGEEVITRNAYGAHCLNTPRALFADIDFESRTRAPWECLVYLLVAAPIVGVGRQFGTWAIFAGLVVGYLLLGTLQSVLARAVVAARGGAEHIARKRERRAREQVLAFLPHHPDWNVRVYRTPNGIRLLATHEPFDPSSPQVEHFFLALGTDPIYIRMCRNQQCFRARLTAKPWRVGIGGHMRPRPGVWPVNPDKLALREQWVADYERAAASYAACRYLESLGSGTIHPQVAEVMALHDRESRALDTNRAIA